MTAEQTKNTSKIVEEEKEKEEKRSEDEKATAQATEQTTKATESNLAGVLEGEKNDKKAKSGSTPSPSDSSNSAGIEGAGLSKVPTTTPSGEQQTPGTTEGTTERPTWGKTSGKPKKEASKQSAEASSEGKSSLDKAVAQKPTAEGKSTTENNAKLSRKVETTNEQTNSASANSEVQKGDKNIRVQTSDNKILKSKTETSIQDKEKTDFSEAAQIVKLSPKSEKKEKKGFFGNIGSGIKKFFTGIGKGVKKGVNGIGKGFGKVSNRLTSKFQNNAQPTKYTNWKAFFDVMFIKGPSKIARKLLLEPAVLPIAGIGSLLNRDESYLKNAWNRWMGSMDSLTEAKDTKKEVASVAEVSSASSKNTHKEGKLVKFSSHPKEDSSIQEISVGDKFYFNHEGSLVLTYEIKDIKDKIVSFVDHDSSKPEDIQTATKEEFLKKFDNSQYCKMTDSQEVKKAA